jgi:hypothetical protein
MGGDLAPGAARGAKRKARQGPGVAQPERIPVVGNDQIEWPVGVRIQIGQRKRGRGGIGMIERLEHQFAARALAGRRPECAGPVRYTGDHTMVVKAEPAAAGLHVQPGHHLGAVGPVPPGRARRAARQLIAVGGKHQGPRRAGPPQENQSAHRRANLLVLACRRSHHYIGGEAIGTTTSFKRGQHDHLRRPGAP